MPESGKKESRFSLFEMSLELVALNGRNGNLI
jgi:hypothetical protein